MLTIFETFIEPGTPLVIFWLFIAAAILVQGISKSGFAGGVGILTIPLMMLVMPVDKVVASLLPLLILLDLNAIYHHRSNKVWSKVLEVYLPSVLGIAAGAVVWWWIGEKGVEHYGVYIKRFVGLIAIFFAFYLFSRERTLSWAHNFRPGRRMALLAGSVAGFTSTIAHAAGPIVSLHLFAQNLGKSLFVGTTAWTFTLINLTKLPVYFAVGLVRNDVLLFDLFLVWLIPIGSYLGKWMHDRVSERLFNRVILVFVLISGFQLLTNVNLVQLLFSRMAR